MRKIEATKIQEAVKKLTMDANYDLPDDVLMRMKEMRDAEESPTGREILDQCIENARIASEEKMPICQDTGFAVFFVTIGEDIKIDGGNLNDAIMKGTAEGYKEGYLRKSILADPIKRTPNTGDNTPPIIWTELVPGDKFTICFAPKGGGSENMSRIKMMQPSDGEEGFVKFVVDTAVEAGGNPCPPVVVGVGVGGTFEKCAWLAKKALLRDIGQRNPDPYYAELETRILNEINKSGVGPQGLGGRATAFDVFIEQFPCHIASFPAAVNLNCHAARHKKIEL